MKVFGREPAAWVGLIEAALVLLVSVGLSWSNEQVGLVMAVVVSAFGAYTAWVTKDTMLGVVVGLTKAVLALGIGFGLDLQPDFTGAVIAFVTVSMGLFNRNQTYPLAAPPETVPGSTPVSVVNQGG